jgi:hypothetical protein
MAREKVIMITYEDKVWNKWLNFTFTIWYFFDQSGVHTKEA